MLYRSIWNLIFSILVFSGICWGYSGGSGTQNDPYQIADETDWQQLMNTPDDWHSNDYFILTSDVDLEGVELTPVGNSSNNFYGKIEGQGHVIRNIVIEGMNDTGLFGHLGSYCIIHNLGLENVEITGNNNVGGLAAQSHGAEIIGCYVIGDVTGFNYAGGLVGSQASLYNSQITDCYTNVELNATGEYVGGLVGWARTDMTSCYALGNVTGEIWELNESVGGLAGMFSECSMTDCYAEGNVTAGGYGVGGLVGLVQEGADLTDCYATGQVNGTRNYIGGLVGHMIHSTVSECFAMGDVSSGSDYVGGLVGYNESGDIIACYAGGSVSGDQGVGGLVGMNYQETVDSCYSTGAVSGAAPYVGGLVGDNWGIVNNSLWDTETSGQSGSAGGEGRTTDQMKLKETFTNEGGYWDFQQTWDIRQKQTYPFLRTCPRGDINRDHVVNLSDLTIMAQNWLIEN